MRIQTVLNRVQKYKSFVYGEIVISYHRGHPALTITIDPRVNSKPLCSRCGKRGTVYDHLASRMFEFIPLWGFLVFFVYAPRRVDCPVCGPTVEKMPWSEGKRQHTTTYAWFLARWAKRLSWAEVARVFATTWYHVAFAVTYAVEWGRSRMDLDDIRSAGIDELKWKFGHRYVTVVYQMCKERVRLLWVGEGRRAKTLLRFFRWLGEERTSRLQYICSDMWKPYLKVIRKKACHALHVLDRFHIVASLNKAIDEVRASEARRMKREGYEPILKGSRWVLLSRPEHLSASKVGRLKELLRYNLKTVRSYILKEDFQLLWDYVSHIWAGRFLDRWCNRVMRSGIGPMKRIAQTIRRHRGLLLNWFKAKRSISAGVVEGMNNKAKLCTKKAYGYSTFEMLQVSLYHTLGDLPEPEVTHRFF